MYSHCSMTLLLIVTLTAFTATAIASNSQKRGKTIITRGGTLMRMQKRKRRCSYIAYYERVVLGSTDTAISASLV